MHTCWLTCISEVLRPHSPCRSATVNTPANRRMPIASVVMGKAKKMKTKMQMLKINCDNFSDLETFYDEIDRVLTKNLNWKTGHNLDAFNDLLRGGFGIFEYGEPVTILWTNFSKSKQTLGEKQIDILIDIIADHKHIEFLTKD